MKIKVDYWETTINEMEFTSDVRIKASLFNRIKFLLFGSKAVFKFGYPRPKYQGR